MKRATPDVKDRLLFVLLVALVASVACQRLPLPVGRKSIPTPTATRVPSPAWEDGNTYRVAMVAAAADDVALIEAPTFYYIRARVDLKEEMPRVHASQTTHYTNKTTVPLEAIYFRLFPNKPSYGSALTFGSVTVLGDEANLDYQAERTAVGVWLPRPLQPGQSVDVQMEYDVTVPVKNARGYGTFNYQDGILLLSNFFAMAAVREPGGWNLSLAPDYGDPVYAETSFYTVEFTAPQGLTVVTSGSTIGKHDNEDGTTT